MFKCNGCSDQVDAGNQPADLQQQFFVVQLRRAATATWRDGNPEMATVVQGRSAAFQRCDHRDDGVGQLLTAAMLFKDCVVTPPPGSVKLGDQWRIILLAYLVDAVFITVQREKAPVAGKAEFLDSCQYLVRTKLIESECRLTRDAQCGLPLRQGSKFGGAL